jgi:hypothetical protein
MLTAVKAIFAYNVRSMLEASDMGTAVLLLQFGAMTKNMAKDIPTN